MSQSFTVSFGGEHPAKIARVKSYTWLQFATLLTAEPPEVADKAERGWYIPAEFNPVYRDSENFVSRSAITFDFDHVGVGAWNAVIEAWGSLAFAMYTTYSNTETKPRFRVVVPLSRPAMYDEFQAVTRKVAADIGIELIARESFVPAQMMYVPTRKPGAPYRTHVNDGDLLDVDAVLAEYDDWTDVKSWPKRAEADGVHASTGDLIAPDQKPGIVGDFCRLYRVSDAIAKFDLPYTPTATEGRWTYTNGSRPEGAIEYDDGLKFHSHHDTDPARGQNNAFDLVRLHMFGKLDAGADASLPIGDRQSYRSMCEFASSLPGLRAQQALSEFEDLGPLVDDPLDAVSLAGKGSPFIFVRPGIITAKQSPVWRIKRLYPQNGIAEVLGNSGDGKSFFIFDTFCSIARGTKWRDRNVEQCGVAYIWAEGRARERVLAYEKKHNVRLDEFNFHILEGAPNLFKLSDTKAIIQALKGLDVRVVAVDTLQATSGGANENSSDMSTYLSNCNAIAKSINGLCVISHHLGKDASKGSRGFSGLKGAADAEITIVRENEQRQAEVTKLKDGAGEGDKHPFMLEEVDLGRDADGDPITSCVVVLTDLVIERKKASRGLSNNGLAVYNALKLMAPSGSVDESDLIAAVAKGLPKEGDGRDLRKRDAGRGLKDCVVKGKAHVSDGRVSLKTVMEPMEEEAWLT